MSVSGKQANPVPSELLRGFAPPEGVVVSTPAAAACPVAGLRDRLRQAGLRPTRQRMLLGWLLFGKGDRHISAEALFQESQAARAYLSIATVYNTLNQFSDAGLLRKVATVGERTVFDTNTGDHHHFLVEHEGMVFDIPDESIALAGLPKAPPGYRVVGVDVVVRIEKVEHQQ
jgi:Fur family iron response transcriptional regulator